jgi:hypothetical protein
MHVFMPCNTCAKYCDCLVMIRSCTYSNKILVANNINDKCISCISVVVAAIAVSSVVMISWPK